MSRYLMVPIHLDVLVVPGEELSVIKQNPDLPIQPYVESVLRQEMNSDTANISESLVCPPFQSQTLRLAHGVHLHWALPDALTRGDSELNFPAAPDRWLVTRKRKIANDWTIDKQWVVESNYLVPPNINKQDSCITIGHTSTHWLYDGQQYRYQPSNYQYLRADIPQPVQDNMVLFDQLFKTVDNKIIELTLDEEALAAQLSRLDITADINKDDKNQLISVLQKPLNRSAQPYRYMGRKLPAGAYKAQFKGAEYYQGLSAVGDGDPAFAAFYPNCFSVFGFHDKELADDLSQVRYEVAGWYGDKTDDVLAELVNTTTENINAAIKSRFDWQVEGEESPERLLCYAGTGFDKDFDSTYENQQDSQLSVTVANTSTEALSACLADRLITDQPALEPAQQTQFLKSLEDQFEAMQMAFRLDEKKLDTVARFKELRHENGFTPVSSGQLWVIRKQNNSNDMNDKQSAAAVNELPTAIAEALNQVNLLQKQYDKACLDIGSLRKQLFADWYKYMICVYPPDTSLSDYPSPDKVKHFIRSKGLAPLNHKIDFTGELNPPDKDGEGHINGITANPSSDGDSLAVKLSVMINRLIEQIETAEQILNQSQDSDANYYLEQIPAPRYWQPNNPVILLEGEGAKATQRHGTDGVLSCPLYHADSDAAFETPTDLTQLAERVSEVAKTNLKTRQPWHPFLLQWQSQLFTTQSQSNQHFNLGTYGSAFITDNYQAVAQDPDLSVKASKGRLTPSGDTYSGNSLLTQEANSLLKKAIETQLINRGKVFEQAQDISLNNYSGDRDFNNPVYSMICAYEKLNTLHILAQSLNGFNEALLMRKQTLELQVDDPLGFERYRDFTSNEVQASLGDEIKNAPSPLNAFNPIRSGCLKMLKLRLVDTFGQVKQIDTNNIDTTYKMTSPASKYLIKLPPRLAQPARLDFRWLDGNKNSDEFNGHPGTSPLCGWLLNNKFDHSLMVYNSDGNALGYFKARRWHQAIDSDNRVTIADIDNAHLRRVVQYIESSLALEADFLSHFIGTTEDALENIQTEKDTGLTGPALLVGRPMAVVRASLDLQLCGLPAVNQNWNVFRGDMAKNTRSSDNFTRVQFPVRLGEYGQLNDGLVGYWLEETASDGSIYFSTEKLDRKGKVHSTDNALFYAPQSDYIDSQAIESHVEHQLDGPINFYQSFDDPAQMATLLMDVQGCVHATVGVLPNKTIVIPPEQYSQALQNIEVSFLHAPILTPAGQTHLALKAAPGQSWSWVEQLSNDENGIVWDERFAQKRIEQADFITQYHQLITDGQGMALWQYLLDGQVNWLVAVDTDKTRAKVVDIDDRVLKTLGDKDALVSELFRQCAVGIDATVTDAVFMGQQEIREGWLKLRRR